MAAESYIAGIQKNTGYMPQLDTLRVFAVFQVLLSHWMRKQPQIAAFPFGETGVNLFFVLSGFLITQILLNGRFTDEAEGRSKWKTEINFYIRRTLRIFPIYYLLILILFIINYIGLRENIAWYLLYASNILFFVQADWGYQISHLWTLGVEEQFYIVWPFIILFIPKKHLLKAIIGIILIGPVFRYILITYIGDSPRASFIGILTPSNIDSFGIGALLAYCRYFGMQILDFKNIYTKLFAGFNLICIILFVFFSSKILSFSPLKFDMSLIYHVIFPLNVSIVSLFLISKASIGIKGIIGKILDNKILMFLGKISYGLYLYHSFAPNLYDMMHLPKTTKIYINFFLYFVLLIIISTTSWYLIEKPVNSLKKRFKY
ncbi:MAG: acyltransferase [bacterium]